MVSLNMPTASSELQKVLSKEQKPITVVVMPDFFADRIVDLNYDVREFASALSSVTLRKGGSVDQISQIDQRGGNALNVASALLALGVKVVPIVCTSKLGLEQIRFHLREHKVDLSHVKIYSKASATTSLEFQAPSGKTNVMLRDLGSLANFGPDDLDEKDYELIESADYVCLFNWAGTLRHGTSLAEAVFEKAKRGKCRTYLDTADPLPNEVGIPDLIERVLKSSKVDILSLNENEAITYASMLSNEVAKQRNRVEFNELSLLSAQVLAKKLQARIDLHTTTFAVSVTGKGAVFVPAFRIKPIRATGAGDAWDAGNVIGDAYELLAECRLTLANALAACYLTDPVGEHPTRKKLLKFLHKAETLSS